MLTVRWLVNLHRTRGYEVYRYWLFLLLRHKGKKHYSVCYLNLYTGYKDYYMSTAQFTKRSVCVTAHEKRLASTMLPKDIKVSG